MKNTYIFIFFALFGNSVLGQDNPYPEVSIASPTAATLGKYGDIPVNYHTGIPEISVPLYTIDEGPLKLPISLSYHGGGVKLLETSSWVGLGWSLNAGGCITRTIQGAPDERNTSNVYNALFGHFSDYGFNNYLYKSSTGYSINYQDWQDFANGNKDGVPDLFFFNFNGYTGKFYFSDDRTPVLVPQQDLKIECVYPGGSSSIQSFTITTPDGIKYSFGNSTGITGDAPVETTNSWTTSTGTSSGNVISSWFLNKIESADGVFAISFQYNNENYGFYTIGTHPVDHNSNDKGYYVVKNLINGVRLSKITTTSGNSEVDFIANTLRTDLSNSSGTAIEAANTSSKRLDEIQIKNSTGFCKQFGFYYGYFQDNITLLPAELSGFSINSDKKRLRLDSIAEQSCDNIITVPPYKFTYSSVSLRRRICFAQDFWGFNNGVDNSTLIPTYSVYDGSSTLTYYNANRNPDSYAVQAGTLTQITYPTGGNTSFDWENNTIETNSTSSNYTSGKEMAANVNYQTSYSQTSTITITNDTHPTLVEISNSSNYASTLDIKDQANNPLYHLVTSNPPYGQTTYIDNESLNLSGGTYTFILTVDSRADPLKGCDINISYNWGSSTSAQNISAGGLRIKTIISSTGDNTASDMVTNYSYDYSGGGSSGILYNVPQFVQSVRNDKILYLGFWSTDGYTPNTLSPNGCLTGPDPTYYISAGNLREMSSVQGSHIGYEQVTVSQPYHGKSVYHYYTTNTGFGLPSGNQQQAVTYLDNSFCFSYLPNYPEAPLPFDYKRGELYYEEHFDNNNFKQKDIFYIPYFDTVSIPATPVFIATYYNWGASSTYLGTFDSMRTAHKDSVVTIEDDYSPAGGFINIQETKYFGSKYHNAVTKETTIDSKNESIQTLYKYAFDYRITSCDNSSCLSTYNSACASCQSNYKSSYDTCDYSDRKCISDAYDAFQRCTNTARIDYVTCSTNSYTTAANCHASAEASANSDLKPILKMQDEYINPPVEVSKWRNGKLLHSTFTRYNFCSGCTYSVYPYQQQLLNLNNPSSSFTASSVSGAGITRDSRYDSIAEKTYKFANGNVVEITPRNSITTSYFWGYNNTYPIAKGINTNSNEIYFSSFEEGGWDTNMHYSTTHVHSGKQAGYIQNTTTTNPPGEVISYSTTIQTFSPPLSVTKAFHYSGWIYSTKPSAQLWLFTKKSGETKDYSVADNIETSVTGKWVFLSKDFDVPATTTQLWMRVDNNANGEVWFDDLRFYPKSAQMKTYTYDPLIGMTSQSDENDRLTTYEYDGLGRLKTIRDQDQNILKQYCYNYAGQTVDCNATALYYSHADTAFDAKSCSGTQIGTVSPYIIKYGNYSSSVNQGTADGLANTDTANNAQTYANSNGACINKANVTVSCIDNSTVSYTCTLTNLATSQQFSTTPAASSTTTISNVPSGSYNITLSKSGDTTPYNFKITDYQGNACYTAGATATFYNVIIGGSGSSISITNIYKQ